MNRPASRAATFPAMSQWARDRHGMPSLADGSAGWAWVYLHCLRAGLVAEDPRIRRGLFRRLAAGLERRPFEASSHLIGMAAPVVVATLAEPMFPEYARLVEPLTRHWLTACALTRETELMVGKAGALLAAAEIHARRPDLLPRGFVRGLQRSVSAKAGTFIKQRRRAPIPLGLPHGLAGHYLALESTAAVFGLAFEHRSACLDLFEEQAVPGPRGSISWPIVSAPGGAPSDGATPCPNAWCHGAAGIGLALLCTARWTKRRGARDLTWAALKTVAQKPRSGVPGFCCGRIGRAQVLIEAYRLTDDATWLRGARAIVEGLGELSWPPSARGFHYGPLGEYYLRRRAEAPRTLPLLGLGALSA